MQQYKNSLWEEFRESVLDSDNYKCVTCGRGASEVILQVHHKRYIHGRKPWVYEPNLCITLCKGCHARAHGIIQS